MLEILLIAVAGSILAGLWDLKTTEVPDKLPVGMVIVGIAYWILQGMLGDWYPFTVSIIVGTALLAIGLIMYKKGQWGGADAWILAAIGYMVPVYGGEIFIVPYLMNFMLVSIFYTVIYSVTIGILNRHVFKYVVKDFRENLKFILGVPAAVIIAILVASAAVPRIIILIPKLVPLIILLLLFWRYAFVIERKVFRKKVPTSKLRKGDVLEKGNWVGLTDRQIKKLRSQKRFVVIKDGMRFVPVFAIALVLTLLFGNLFFSLL
ncbi:MAG: A24 family peptidase [Candidatus Aenigmatarchaeota archaeon]